jgi:hypothetical protein
MADERTPGQREADSALHEAIQRCAIAYDLPGDCVITNWVVVGAALGADEDGTDRHHEFSLLQDNGLHMSDSLLIGMLRTATIRAERAYQDNGDDE